MTLIFLSDRKPYAVRMENKSENVRITRTLPIKALNGGTVLRNTLDGGRTCL